MSTTHKKSELTAKGEFTPLPDGNYPGVLDNVTLDMANKYGPRLALTFKLPNRRLVWINLSENKKGELKGAWRNLGRLGVGRLVTEKLGDEFTTEQFLTVALEFVETLVGHYFDLELKTFEGNDKQYASIEDKCTDEYFNNFKMPKTDNIKKAEMNGSPPELDTSDIPF
jgi:hypothetical protein